MHVRKLLIVDDDPDTLDTLQSVLMDEGYDIETANSGPEALKKMGFFPAEVVLTDYVMPDMNGIELIKKIKKRYFHVIPILLTGRADVTLSFKAINQGEIFRFLLKPWNNEELKITLHNAFQYSNLIFENEMLMKIVARPHPLLEEIEKKYPGITQVTKEVDGTVLIEEEDDSDIINSFQIKEEECSDIISSFQIRGKECIDIINPFHIRGKDYHKGR